MYRNPIIMALRLLLICCLPVAASATSLWKVSHNGNTLYIGGTVHLLSPADYPLPEAFEQAYAKADVLVLETDLKAVQQPGFHDAMLQKMRLPEGQTLQTLLDSDVYLELKSYLDAHSIPMDKLEGFRPSMVALTLTVIEMQRLGMAGTGVDAYFNLKADHDGKARYFLESPEEQIGFITGMGQGRENEFIRYTLSDLDSLPRQLGPMITAWRNGDAETLEKLALTPWKKDFPHTYKTILVKRNKAWYPQIREMLRTPETELVLVGALHLVGKNGVLNKLQKHGYEVVQVETLD